MRWGRGAAKPLRTEQVAVRPLARGQGRERGLNALHRPENHGQRPVPPHRGYQHTEWHNTAGEDPGNDRQAFAPGSRILPGAPCQTIKATDRAATRRHGACHLSAAGRRDGRAASDLPADGGTCPGPRPAPHLRRHPICAGRPGPTPARRLGATIGPSTAPHLRPSKSGPPRGPFLMMAEGGGFEPPTPFGEHAFQACALSRSAIPPPGRRRRRRQRAHGSRALGRPQRPCRPPPGVAGAPPAFPMTGGTPPVAPRRRSALFAFRHPVRRPAAGGGAIWVANCHPVGRLAPAPPLWRRAAPAARRGVPPGAAPTRALNPGFPRPAGRGGAPPKAVRGIRNFLAAGRPGWHGSCSTPGAGVATPHVRASGAPSERAR